MTVDVERLPPQDVRAEMSLLGACLRDRQAVDVVLNVAEPAHFYRPAHEVMWRSIVSLVARGEAVDTLTVSREMAKHGADAADAYDLVTECYDATPTAANVEHYMGLLHETWVRREVVRLAFELEACARDSSSDMPAMLSSITQRALDLQIRRQNDRPLKHVGIIVDELEAALSKGLLCSQNAVSTGFPSLDQLMQGYQPSDLHYWGGGPGSGKTTLSMQSACRVAAASPDRLVAYFSMELGESHFARRLASFASSVPGSVMESGPASRFALELPKILNGLRKVRGLPLHVAFGRFSTAQIQARCKQLMASENRRLSVVFVDRIELLSDSDCAALEETKRIPILSPRVKGLATALDVPVVCLVQLNRAGRVGEPTMEAFRGSGAIEQDCQVGAIIRSDKIAMTATVDVVKNNDGATGQCPQMRFDPNLPMFSEFDRRHS